MIPPESSLLLTLGAGVTGGLILNVMPCVLPGLFFKVQRVVQHAHEGGGAARQRAEGLAFLAGSLTTFSAFALAVSLLRASGRSLGWGMQMQSPTFVALLTLVTLLFGLNAFGAFEVNLGLTQRGSSDRGALAASFLDGVFITLISTPCSAPILGTAITAALASDGAWWETLALFWSIGAGLSLPVLVVSFVPALARLVPRPGEWMVRFKQLVGLSLVAATFWLYTQLENLLSREEAAAALGALYAVGAGAWLHAGREGAAALNEGARAPFWRRRATGAALLALPLASYALWGDLVPREQSQNALYALCAVAAAWLARGLWARRGGGARAAWDALALALAASAVAWAARAPVERLPWAPFSEAALAEARGAGRPVFVDFTADWCQSCKAFEALHLNTEGMAAALRAKGVVPMKADLTRSDDALWGTLKRLGRDGLPAYVLYRADGSYELLPEGPPLSLGARVAALP
ncbi:MAG: hypothetical protein FJ138_04655 [Deltaproteobacteria bacterium]|nr:hypothetical protein [Deltaproteobacteria bacterium]